VIPLRDVIPSRTTPYVTIGLIVVNVLVFLYEITLNDRYLEEFVLYFGLVPAAFSWGRRADVDVRPRRRAARRHEHAFPLIFGDNVEDRMGHGRFSSSICSAVWRRRWHRRG
jgi:membrane associated rhomboid family serine protease